jgi:hypothetical protein
MKETDRGVVWGLVLVLIVIAIELAWFAGAGWTDPVGNILTLLAAFVGGWFITSQIRASDKQVQRQRDAKFLAARAAMPLSLSAATRYAKECVNELTRIYATRDGPHLSPVKNLIFPQFPNEAITEFRILIEYGPPAIHGAIATLLQKIQVQRARLEWVEMWNTGNDRYILGTWNLEEYLVDAIEVYVRTGHMYEYGRFEADMPRPTDTKAMEGGVYQLVPGAASTLLERVSKWKPHFEVKPRSVG